MSLIKISTIILTCALLAACGNLSDDLIPSGNDLRAAVTSGSTGNQVSQTVSDFSASNTNNGTFVLADHLAGGTNASDAVVLYFTMWCPICMSHIDHLFFNIIPQFKARGKTTYVLVDYVSGSISATVVSEAVNGYAGSIFTTIADENQAILGQLGGAMGKVIVIDGNGIIQMSEDFKTGANLVSTLDKILP
ncbi:MAG: redoxin family protein [Ghiorsea sp.]